MAKAKEYHDFCRGLWEAVQIETKKAGYEPSDCWVYKYVLTGEWEFHVKGFSIHLGCRADCSWSAKAYGWLRLSPGHKTII